MKWYLALCTTLLLLCAIVSCDAMNRALSPEKKVALTDTYLQMLADGRISQTQYDALIRALEGDSSLVWERLIQSGVDIGLALLGVRVWRGSITDRKGVAAIETVPTKTTTG